MLLKYKYTILALFSLSFFFTGISDKICKVICKDCAKPCCEENYKLSNENFEYLDLLDKNNIAITNQINEVIVLEAQNTELNDKLQKAKQEGAENVAVLQEKIDENSVKLERIKNENKLLDSLNLVKDTTITKLNSENINLIKKNSFLNTSNDHLKQIIEEKKVEISKKELNKTNACEYLKTNLLEVNISYFKRFLFWKVRSTKSIENYLFENNDRFCLNKVDSIEIKGTICVEDRDLANKVEYKFCIFEIEKTGASREINCIPIYLKQIKNAAYLFNIKKLFIPKTEDSFQELNSSGRKFKIEIRSRISKTDNELLKTYIFTTY